MTFTAADPGAQRGSRAYGSGLSDFAGETRLTLVRDDMTHRLVGDGNTTGTRVRFHQKDPGPDDRDVRVWVFTDGGDGTFLAEPVAAF